MGSRHRTRRSGADFSGPGVGLAAPLVAIAAVALALAVVLWIAVAAVSPVSAARRSPTALERSISRSHHRVALVIGNRAYGAKPLNNPVNDARAMAGVLEELGFSVIVRTDADLTTMKQAVGDFSARLEMTDIALFYFSGHGVQVGGLNYLLPVEADISSGVLVRDQAVSVSQILAAMHAGDSRCDILILDACRDTPQAGQLPDSGPGLAEMGAPAGSLIAFATAPGTTASDGTGPNGLYTGKLIANLRTPGLRLVDVFNRTRLAVRQATNNRQVPTERFSLEEPVFLAGKPGTDEQTVTPSRPNLRGLKRRSDGGYVNSIGIRFRLIPAGGFMMGSRDGRGLSSEKPSHRVTISRSFLVAVTETTQAQWQGLMKDNPSRFIGLDRPVESVSWQECRAFIAALNKKEEVDVYRLPTEAEWEYACRAGRRGGWSFGDDEQLLSRHAWFRDNADGRTHPVGGRIPNRWGLFDLHGNVAEWCADAWDDSYYWRSPRRDPQGGEHVVHKSIRGGSWRSEWRDTRSAFRWRCRSLSSGPDLGFRLVREWKE